MHGTDPSASKRTLSRGVAGGVLALILCLATGYADADTPNPQLSIAVDNGQASAVKGDRLAYTITVTNLGASKVRDLVITQSVPAGASFVSADARGVHRAGKVTWKLNLKATKKVIVHASMTVAATPDELLRLATVACAQISTTGPPLVCASDSDQLPAGAVAESAQQAAEQPAFSPSHRFWWYTGGAVALAGVAAASLLAVRTRSATHRRRRRTQPG